MSPQEEFALLSEDDQQAVLAELPQEVIDSMARQDWWWAARPEQVPPKDLDWNIFLFLAGRGSGKTRSGAEWLVERTEDHPYDSSGFPAERLVMAYSLSDARTVCIEGPSGVIRVLLRKGYEEVKDYFRGDREGKFHYIKSPKPCLTLLETGAKIFFSGSEVDAARGLNLADVWCVAKGEPVATANGLIPIEDVRPGDLAWTDLGFKEVVRSGITKRNVQVLRIVTESGDLRVTGDHQVWVNDVWQRADLVNPGDTMATCLVQMNQSPAKLPPSMSGMANPGTTTSGPSTTTAVMDSCCTGPSGLQPSGQSQKTMTSTTSTGIAGIPHFPTSNASKSLNTCAEPGRNVLTRTRQILLPDRNGLQKDFLPCGPGVTPGPSSVLNAGRSSIPLECDLNGAARSAATRRPNWLHETGVLHAEWVTELTDVYDLTVADAAHFYAGTAMVKIHNCDEIIKWAEPAQVWREGIRPALRADIPGDKPRAFVTTTPRPIALLQDWLKRAASGEKISVVRGSTFDNKLNLSEDFLHDITQMYEGTALGRQELYGEMLDMLDGALFSYHDIDSNRVNIGPERVAHRTVGVDPGLTGAEDGDEMGVVVAVRSADDHIYVLADKTVRMAGRDAAIYAWRIFDEYGADTLVYESNLGKAWMQQVFTDAFRELQRAGIFPKDIANPPLVPVFSNQGKKLRAEPVAMRYAQGRVHHIGTFEKLESQMLMFDPITSKVSPDRLDALVHACRHLMSGERRRAKIFSPINYQIDSLAREPI